MLVDALAGRSAALVNIDRVGAGIEDARRAVALARDMGYLAGEALALGISASARTTRRSGGRPGLGHGKPSRSTRRSSPAGSPGGATIS